MTLNEKGLEAAYIRLSQGRFVLVDAADYDFLMQRKWHLLNNYAYSSTKRPTISMLRYFLHYHYGHKIAKTSYPHPTLLEKMMGFPIGHTVLKPLETQ